MPFVYEITNGLSDQVTRNGKAGKSVIGKNLPSFLTIFFGDCRLVHIEVIAPTGKLQAVVAHFGGFLSQGLERIGRPIGR